MNNIENGIFSFQDPTILRDVYAASPDPNIRKCGYHYFRLPYTIPANTRLKFTCSILGRYVETGNGGTDARIALCLNNNLNSYYKSLVWGRYRYNGSHGYDYNGTTLHPVANVVTITQPVNYLMLQCNSDDGRRAPDSICEKGYDITTHILNPKLEYI